MISKEQILSKVSAYDILNHYLKPYNNNSHALKAGKNISNPFLPEKQKTPSFNIYQSTNSDGWRFHDFATGDNGSCFDLVMKLNNVSFPEAIQMINHDLSLMLDTEQSHEPPSTNTTNSNHKFSTVKRSFIQPELDYWQKFGITSASIHNLVLISI